MNTKEELPENNHSLNDKEKNEVKQNEIKRDETKQDETKPIRYYWFDSFLEFNMYNTRPSQLMDLEKRYGVSLSHTPNYDTFINEINKKKKEEKEREKKGPNLEIKCLECEKRNRSQAAINSHLKTECKLIDGCNKYKNYPNWIKKIINTDTSLYEDLKYKSKSSRNRFEDHCSIDSFLQSYYDHEEMMDRLYGW